MARPPVDKLAPTNTTASVSWGEFTQIFGGNVDLQPYSAKQADISLEWYFSENSIFNVAAFYKRIENQITSSWEPGQDIGVPGFLFNISRPINGDHAKVHGFEAGVQHFWQNGLGFRAQYTRNSSKSFVAGEERPLEGIAPSVYSRVGDVREAAPGRSAPPPITPTASSRPSTCSARASTSRRTRSPGSPRTPRTTSTRS